MSDPTLAEVKEAVDALQSGWSKYKDTNDKRLEDIEKKGAADPLHDEKLARMDTFLDEQEDITKANKKRHEEIVELQKQLAKEYGERLDKIETAVKRAPRATDGEAAEAVAEQKAIFLNFCRKGPEMDPALAKLGLEQKLLSLGDQTQAGFLAGPEMVNELIKAIVEFSPFRDLARVRSTSRTSIHVPKRTGVFSAAWTAEQGTRTERTGLTYGLEEIPTHELYALTDITEQMLEDSLFNLEAELNLEFTEQFGVAEGIAFLTGTSAGQPEGLLNNTAIAEDNSGNASLIEDASGQANGLIDLQHNLKTGYARNASWILNRKTLGAIRKLKDGNNNYIWAAGAAVGNPATILGDPYTEMPDMPDVAANANPIAYGDWARGYSVVDRIALSVLRDPFTQATSGAIRFIARRRVGGQVVLAEAIRKLKVAT